MRCRIGSGGSGVVGSSVRLSCCCSFSHTNAFIRSPLGLRMQKGDMIMSLKKAERVVKGRNVSKRYLMENAITMVCEECDRLYWATMEFSKKVRAGKVNGTCLQCDMNRKKGK